MVDENGTLPASYNAFNVYCRELAPGTISLTGDRAQGDDSKHWAYSSFNYNNCIIYFSGKLLCKGGTS